MAKAQLTVEQYKDAVERSQLLEPELIDGVIQELKLPLATSCAQLAQELQDRKLLSSWHNSHLMNGRFKGFFLGKYKLLRMLGAGGMGAVYLGEHVLMQRKVAIKVLYASQVDKTNLERFYLESQAVAALDDPNIVRAHHFDSIDEFLYLVMEFVDGPDLQTLVDKHGPLPYLESAEYIAQAACGLAHAHDAGMVHRDIKPANFLRDPKGVIKLLDLGVARMTKSQNMALTMPGGQSMLGTVDYLAPEQALDAHTVDARADIYSLGCTLYFLLTGHPPFPEGTQAQRLLAHQIQNPTPVREERPDAPAGLLQICDTMMAKSADDRPQTANEVAAALQEWVQAEMKAKGISEIPQTAQGLTKEDELAGPDTKLQMQKAAEESTGT